MTVDAQLLTFQHTMQASQSTAQGGGTGTPARQQFSYLKECATNPSLFMLMKELRSALSGCDTVLDVGCGNISPMRFVNCRKLVGVDGYAPSLEEARKNGTHDEYCLADVRKIGTLLGNRRFDACVALDVIEHLPKEDGWKMVEQMEQLSTGLVIIFTPNGFMPQRSKNGDLQEHLSGWTADEMRAKGYKVYGMYGPKQFRGEYHMINRQPRILWLLASFFRHYTGTLNQPEQAAAILCIKDKRSSR